MCSCGSDNECMETITDMFGSMIISNDKDLNRFRSACSHFDKVVLGMCPDSSI